MNPMQRTIAIVLTVLLAKPALGDVFVPDDFQTIQSAIDSTLSGATIRVRPGTYVEHIDFRGKAITIVSEEGPLRTTIDAAPVPDGPVVRCDSGEGLDTVLEGFTITGGSGDSDFFVLGGGIFIFEASMTVRNCIITGNRAQFGAGVYVQLGSPHFVDCVFRQNTADFRGGGFYETIAGSVLTNCSFAFNEALGEAGPFAGVGGGFLTDTNTSPTLTNCTFYGNTATNGAGAIHDEDGNALVVNSIIWGNDAPNVIGTPAIQFSDVEGGYSGTGNIAVDPQLMVLNGLFLRLRRTSPCIDAADGALPNVEPLDLEDFDRSIDGDGDGDAEVDMGAFEFNPRVLNTTSGLRYGGLQEAINDAVDGDELVADPGLYREAVDFEGTSIALRSAAGRDQTTIDARGLADPAVVCASGEGRDAMLDGFTVTGDGSGMHIFSSSPTVTSCRFADNIAVFGGGISMDNASPVVSDCEFENNSANTGGGMLIDDGSSPVISGCAFLSNVAERGAGIAVTDDSAPTITGCTFHGNAVDDDGAGAFLVNSPAVFEQCVFEENEAGDRGGGAHCAGTGGAVQPRFVECDFIDNPANAGGGLSTTGTDVVVTSCAFQLNSASDGGGVFAEDGQPQFVTCDFDRNTAVSGGGAINDDTGADTILVNCTFTLNAAFDGGAILNEALGRSRAFGCVFDGNTADHGGAAMNDNEGGATFERCTFHQNFGRHGGAMYNESGSSQPEYVDCTFTGNTAESGGVMYGATVGHATFKNCVFASNNATLQGGTIGAYSGSTVELTNCVIRSSLAPHGGAFDVAGASALTLVNCTVYGSTATVEAAYLRDTSDSSTRIANSILWGHIGTPFDGTGIRDIHHSAIDSGAAGEANIDADPMFVDAAAGNFRLQRGSPCIDAGDGTAVPPDLCDLDLDLDLIEPIPLDAAGAARFVDDPATDDTGIAATAGGAVVDIGAFEYAPCPGDFDGDGHIGFDELAILLGNWGLCPGCPQDLDGDGTVGFNDLSILLGNWGDECPEQ